MKRPFKYSLLAAASLVVPLALYGLEDWSFEITDHASIGSANYLVNQSLGVGYNNLAYAPYSSNAVIGYCLENYQSSNLTVGQYNTSVAGDLFTVGNGTSNTDRRNALTVSDSGILGTVNIPGTAFITSITANQGGLPNYIFSGSHPEWWYSSVYGIIVSDPDPGPGTDNSPANIGQLKHVATQAMRYLDSRFAVAGGSGQAIKTMCTFTHNDNYAPVAIGQLKNVAKVFWDRLAASGYNRVTQSFQNSTTSSYPWTGATVQEGNAAPASIGQLKQAFSFNISDAFLTMDTDGDTIANFREVQLGYNYTLADSDGNGINDSDPLSLGKPDADSDGDGLLNRLDAVPDDPLLTFPPTPESRYVLLDLGPGTAHSINASGQVLRGRLTNGVIEAAVISPAQYNPSAVGLVIESRSNEENGVAEEIQDLLGLADDGKVYVVRTKKVVEAHAPAAAQPYYFNRINWGPNAWLDLAAPPASSPFDGRPWNGEILSAYGADTAFFTNSLHRCYVTGAGALVQAYQSGGVVGPEIESYGSGSNRFLSYKWTGLWWTPTGAVKTQFASSEVWDHTPVPLPATSEFTQNPPDALFATWLSASREGQALHEMTMKPPRQPVHRLVHLHPTAATSEIAKFGNDAPFLIASVPSSENQIPAQGPPSKGPIALARSPNGLTNAWVWSPTGWRGTRLMDKDNFFSAPAFFEDCWVSDRWNVFHHPLAPLFRRANVGTAGGLFLRANKLWRNGSSHELADLVTLAPDATFDAADMNASGRIAGTLKLASGIHRAAVLVDGEIFLNNQNLSFNRASEALGVSNYVTTVGLPVSSQFSDGCTDPENFRLQAIMPSSTSTSVVMKLEVIRDTTVVWSHNYTLDQKDGYKLRGRFLRLVTDPNDDAASGNGATSDPSKQTILVKLGDSLKASYDSEIGTKVAQEILIGRPMSENNNGTSQKSHDIREVKIRILGFGGCVTAAQID